MAMGWFRRAAIAAALVLLCPFAAQAIDIDATLQRADALRSADPQTFSQLVDSIERHAAGASAPQRRHLRLLQDYRAALQGDYGRAVGDAVALFDQAPEASIRYRAALLVANISAVNRDYGLGLRYLDRALALQSRVSDPALRSMGYVVAGTLYNEFGHYELALDNADRLLAAQPDPRNRCLAQQIRVRALEKLATANASLDRDIQHALDDCAAQHEVIAVNIIRTTLAEKWAADGRRSQATALLEASLPEVRATGYTRLLGEIHGLLASYKYEAGDVPSAQAHARFLAGLKGQDPRWSANVTAHLVLYRIALARRDFATALKEYRLYAEADKALLDDVKTREYAFQLSRHELNQKNQSIALLQSQNRLLEMKQQAARASAWNTRLAITLLLVLVATLGYWGWRARRTHGSLRTLAETDGLTGLSNRRHFRASSEAALALCAQRQRPVTVLLFDLDHFKQINDQCGHSSGDWVLREVARVGRLHCRESDLFGRIGGEEFAMTLVDCEIHQALGIAETCRRAIAAIDAGVVGCGLPVAASIGVVSSRQVGYEYEALIAHADAAMYRSKVGGRNRVTLYEPPAVPEAGQPLLLDRSNAAAMLRQY